VGELPKGWELTNIDDIAHVTKLAGFEFTNFFNYQEQGEIRVVRGLNIGTGVFKDRDFKYIDTKTSELLPRSSLLGGEILITYVGSIGAVAILPNDGNRYHLGPNVAKISVIHDICYSRILLLYLMSPDGQKSIHDTSKAVAQSSLSMKQIRGFQIPLPPLNEQRRIADRLDLLLTRIDKAKTHLDRIPPLLKRFRQSVLAAATSGKLTEDWREANGLGLDDWEDIIVEQLIQRIEAGVNVKCEERPPLENEYGLVKISAVTWGTYNDEQSKTIPSDYAVPEHTRISVGDFLMSRANTLELVGACVIVDQVNRPVFLSDKVLRIVMKEQYKQWILFSLRSEKGRKQIEGLSSGNQLSMRNITQTNIKSIELKLPGELEREEIVRRVEALFAKADRIEAQYKIARQQVDRLTPALLAKAFRGQLVPQDPTDEPASALLERIRQQRDASPEPKKKRIPKKSSNKVAQPKDIHL
jgi:type I restriction enzyme, S subunit